MKKSFSLLLICVLLWLPLCSSAIVFGAHSTEAPAVEFNKDELEKSSYYAYDRYKKQWRIASVYQSIEQDAEISFYLLLFDEYVETTSGPEFRVTYIDKELNAVLPVTALRVIIGDHLFRFEKPYQSTVGSSIASCSTLIKMCNALIDEDVKNIGFQIEYSKRGLTAFKTFEKFSVIDLAGLKAVAKALKESNAWTIYKDNEARDAYYLASYE